jgi:uncharacterized membrane protein
MTPSQTLIRKIFLPAFALSNRVIEDEDLKQLPDSSAPGRWSRCYTLSCQFFLPKDNHNEHSVTDAPKRTSMKFSRLQILFLTVLALGVFFRFSGLGNKMYSHDEAYTAISAAGYTRGGIIDAIWDGQEKSAASIRHYIQPDNTRDVFDTLDTLAKSEPQLTPLYFVATHYWMRVVGHSPAEMRLLSALISLLTIPGMYWLCCELFLSRRTALFSVAIISLSPFHLLFAQDARPYSLLASITLLASAAFLLALRQNKKRHWAIYSVLLIVGIYSHILFGLVAFAHAAYILTNLRKHQNEQFTRYFAAFFLALLAFTPWLYQIVMNFPALTGGLSWTNSSVNLLRYLQRWILVFASPFVDFRFGNQSIVPYILRIPALLLFGYALVFLVATTPRRIWAFLLLLIGISTLPFFLSDLLRGGILSITGRYFVGFGVAAIPVLAHVFAVKLDPSKAPLSSKWLLITGLLFMAQVISGFNSLASDTWWVKNLSWNHPQILEILNQSTRPLLIVYGNGPTDLGDVLSLSEGADQDVRFLLADGHEDVEITGTYSDIYIFHRNQADFIKFKQGELYQTAEVVPGCLWQVKPFSQSSNPSIDSESRRP